MDIVRKVTSKLKKECRDTGALHGYIMVAGENKIKKSKGENNPEAFQPIIISLAPAGDSAVSAKKNTVISRGPDIQKAGSASGPANTAGKETKVFYSEEWLIGLLGKWGYSA